MTRFHQQFTIVLALVFSIMATPLAAQLCRGVPLTSGQTAVTLGADFPNLANTFGVNAAHSLGNWTLGAGYSLTTFDILDLPAMHTVGLDAAVGLQPIGTAETPVGVCPVVGLAYTSWEELSMISVPVGVSLGTAFAISEGAALLAPYVNPFFVWAQGRYEGETESDSDLGVSLGANLLVGNLLFGGTWGKVGEAPGVFGLRVGMTF